jgi:hypothetical protein
MEAKLEAPTSEVAQLITKQVIEDLRTWIQLTVPPSRGGDENFIGVQEKIPRDLRCPFGFLEKSKK